jgi:hypothetical protein
MAGDGANRMLSLYVFRTNRELDVGEVDEEIGPSEEIGFGSDGFDETSTTPRAQGMARNGLRGAASDHIRAIGGDRERRSRCSEGVRLTTIRLRRSRPATSQPTSRNGYNAA